MQYFINYRRRANT